MHSGSLLKRLALLASLVLLIALGLVGYALSQANYRSAVSALQLRMEAYVYQVLAVTEPGPAGRPVVDNEFADPRLIQPGSGTYVMVAGRHGEWRSDSSIGVEWPQSAAPEPGQAVFTEPDDRADFFAYEYGVAWEMDDGTIEPFTVRVLVDRRDLAEQTRSFQSGLWQSLVAAGAILLLAQIVIFLVAFRPLRRVAGDVARIESGQAPRLEGGYPRELEPLARNVNRLLETEKSNQRRIRNALDSLAHSLKTPLAVIQAGIPLHGGKSAESMQNAVDEMSRLVATRLERAGSTARRTLAEPVAVAPQWRRINESLQKVYSHKMIESHANIDDELAFYGEKRDLLELLGNLADNAYKYGDSQVRLAAGAVGAEASRPGIWLRVEDDGPGIDEAQWPRLLQRGSRGDERVEGHGLGLAIVLELVTAYGGEMTIGNSELGGARIDIQIPPA